MSREELLQACLTLSKHLGLVAAELGTWLCCRGSSAVAVQWGLREEDPMGGVLGGRLRHGTALTDLSTTHCLSQGTERESDSRAQTRVWQLQLLQCHPRGTHNRDEMGLKSPFQENIPHRKV